MAKKALVSGGSSGIGQGIAIALAAGGWEVAVTWNRNAEGALQTKRTIEEKGGVCHIVEAHLERPEAPEKMVRDACRLLGGLDAYVCNAGRDARSSILTATREQIQNILDTNFLGYMLSAGEAARHMVRHGVSGSIVFITSTRAISPHPDDFLYGGIKAAVERACKSLALDLSPYGIRVNCIAPGATLVRPWQQHDVKPGELVNGQPWYPIEDLIPLHRMGVPADVAAAAVYLCGEQSSYITGVSLPIDGGLSLPGMPEWFAPCEWTAPGWTHRHRAEMDRVYPSEDA